MMPILIKGDDVRSGTMVSARHGARRTQKVPPTFNQLSEIFFKFLLSKTSKSRAAEEICHCLQLCFEVVNMLTMNYMCSVRLCNKLAGRS